MRRIRSRAASWLVVAAVTAMLSPVSMVFAAVNNNEVTSVKIKEADGTSGQDTNSGSGVKTGHIQDGAVTEAKIVGPISTTKLNVGTTVGTVAAGDHSHDTLYQKKYSNVVVVSKNGGDFTDPITAINSIIDASASNPYLIKIMPGVYEITTPLSIKNYVDIEGSGENNTKIVGALFGTAVIIGSSYSEIKYLTIQNTDGGAFMDVGTNTKLKNMTIISNIIGVYLSGGNGYDAGGTTELYDVTIISNPENGQCLRAANTRFLLDRVSCSASSFGVSVAPTVALSLIRNSSISSQGVNNSVAVEAPAQNLVLFNTQIVSGGTSGMVKCVNVYDANFNPITCP